MPEELAIIDIHSALELLEDYTLDTRVQRNQNYRLFQNALDNNVEMSCLVVDRLLAVCVHDLKEDKQYSLTILKIINSILKRTMDGQFSSSSLKNLLPSILEILNIIKTVALLSKMETLQVLSFETAISYPDDILIELAISHSKEVIEIVNLYSPERIPPEIRCLPCKLVLRLLQVLPMDKKTIFLKANLKVWFTKLIPTIVLCMQNEVLSSKPLETLEALTEGLSSIDYSQDPNWLIVLECIYNPQKYPQIMKNMLEKGSKTWHRLWIAFIRLLKNQITRSNSPGGSPINSMLPVVETAFKMDVSNRCRAFQCWDVLIDNFHRETSETNVVKMVKLLIVPLKSNNAKVEETALTKLSTWWHLIRSFQSKIDKFLDPILISFLHFCFGQHARQNKQLFVPCLLTESTKKKAVEAFIEIAGHMDCPGCVDFPKLKERIITKKALVDFWNDWVFSLKVAISLSMENIGVTPQQITCAWKSFVLVISDLPDNNIRKDLFHELLCMLETMVQYGLSNDNKTEFIFYLIMSLFENVKIKPLLRSKGEEDEPMHKILSLVMRPSLNIYYRSQPIKDIISKLKLIANYIMDETLVRPRKLTEWIFLNFSQYCLSFFWTALCEALLDFPQSNIDLDSILMWPLQSDSSFSDVTYSSLVWYKLFGNSYPQLSVNSKDKINTWIQEKTPSNLLFKLYGALVILNHSLTQDKDHGIPVELLMTVTNKVEHYKQIESICNLLTETLASVLNKQMLDKEQSENAMTCVQNIMSVITKEIQVSNNLENHALTLDRLLDLVDAFFISFKKSHKSKITTIIDELVTLSLLVNNHEKLKTRLLHILDMSLSFINTDPTYAEIKKAIENLKSNSESVSKTTDNINEKIFTTPNTKVTTRKAKKKEANVVNTVVENGEEFVVVKSNWKFNPRKLTENQKEKFQRKREDIPALYQDLSQSQDEFKLKTWKTDSQDSSSTSKSTSVSKSSNVEDVTNILKNIRSSDVVPKIIENNFSDNDKKESVEETTVKTTTVNVDSLKSLSSPKTPKSPRIALKDRVFRNVRNLIEKSGAQKDNKDLSESLTQIENIPKTPISKPIDPSSIINSAPPKINAERPSRVKRKPKKFDDAEMIALKRNRPSLSQSESQPECSVINEKHIQNTVPPIVPDKISNEDNNEEQNNKAGGIQIDPPIKTSNEVDKADLVVKNDALVEKATTLPVETPSNVKSDVESVNTVEELRTSDSKPVNIELASDSKQELETNDNNIKEKANVDVVKKQQNKELDDAQISNSTSQNVKTPKSTKKAENGNQKSSVKKNGVKKSRIEKELAIDTVEGHPFLKINTERRVTRKNIVNPVNSSRRKSLTEKINKSKSDAITPSKAHTSKKKDKELSSNESTSSESVIVNDSPQLSQTNSNVTEEDFPLSEDIIESSQDSTFTTISTTSTKSCNKKVTVTLEKIPLKLSKTNISAEKQTHADVDMSNKSLTQQLSNSFDKADDSDFPQNRTVSQKSDMDLTETMDTEPIDSNTIELKDNSSDVIIINDDDEPIVINTEDTCVGPETQEIAEADTEPTDINQFLDDKITDKALEKKDINLNNIQQVNSETTTTQVEIHQNEINTDNDVTETIICESLDMSSKIEDAANTVSSPFKDDEQRKKDFLDNTLEISPIKTMSPVKEQKSPSPETSSDYVVIKLTSPVQSNGEPFEKCDSPEVFTEEKISPDKRDLSPPREENSVNNNSSPSSSLSLKKNKPQVRSGRRAAQMLGLCVPDRLQTIINKERSETEEPKRVSPSSTPARRNLRILYNSVGDSSENSEENEDSENFLKFKRSLPTSDCSPSNPILKRKLAEITDDATVTPPCKRKRVSFHDPPVSTTVSVQKYIEPCGIRSPQNSALKRQERQNLRSQTVLKSPKRLDNVFKLDSVLTKAVESFTEVDQTGTEDTQSMSLDETPAVEIVKNCDLNDTDPLCPELVDCMDSIEVIASDLSSPTMKVVFLKELEGKLTTVGDLAKMTELEVNRLCIKAPKVKIAKKVLSDYALKKAFEQTGPKEVTVLTDDNQTQQLVCDAKMDIETQTDSVVSINMETQTVATTLTTVSVQTDKMKTCHKDVQTVESGSKSTKAIITSCLLEKPDFIELLSSDLDESSKLKIAETLPFEALKNAFMNKVDTDNSRTLINEILEKHNEPRSQIRNGELSILQEVLCERFSSSDLILLCSQLLAKVHARTS